MRKSTTKKLAGTGIFAALAFLVSFLEFPIFSAVPFLKLDFSLVFILLAGFSFGPVSGMSACLIKELLRFAFGSSSGGIGEVANAIVTFAFILVPTTMYKYRKGFTIVVLTLVIGSLLEIIASLLVNRYISFPLFMGEQGAEIFSSVWFYVAVFNLIKSFMVSVITVLLYKRVSYLIKRI